MWGLGLLIALSMMQNPSRDVIRRCLTPPEPCPEAQQQIYGDEHYPVAEPIDVPAVQVDREPRVSSYLASCDNGEILVSTGNMKSPWACRKTTCGKDPDDPDRKRILLTDEAGGKHCIKFPGAR
jgi:hypothetical protein